MRDRYGLDGTGITIGILSDSFATAKTFDASNNLDTYATNIADGYLPCNVNVLKDYAKPDTTDEGRALLQIVHAVAPGANLAFHTSLSNFKLRTSRQRRETIKSIVLPFGEYLTAFESKFLRIVNSAGLLYNSNFGCKQK
ncbi:hypothetical protein NIES4072_25990 [Nostoc commune NIES-4072]|uniref:Uncharacterized protein n=1 Tax=Nostoc commune NIES-4072 TaxID=2005467 RepID=A0A2R5FTC6_NOSCO|nr:hypothetical protein [Nostoc commune]BBD63745.1 hypothetical protein NIES4070_00870 [Nostoc commune HK-02]GBG18934.1 hypothetical protein NIES4072_25990 [Nostoc commune NIES-4072]